MQLNAFTLHATNNTGFDVQDFVVENGYLMIKTRIFPMLHEEAIRYLFHNGKSIIEVLIFHNPELTLVSVNLFLNSVKPVSYYAYSGTMTKFKKF